VNEKPLFEVKFKGRQVLLRVTPPEGKLRANLNDIQKFLRSRQIEFRHEVLFDIFRRASNDFEPLSQRDTLDYEVEVEVSEDKMKAWITIVAPDVGDASLHPNMIKEALERVHVNKGIFYESIKKLLAEKQSVQRKLIAEGKPKLDGEDGTLEFLEEAQVGQMVEDNTVDYRELNTVKNVTEGTVIARIHVPTPGENGFTVDGKVLKAKIPKKARLKIGRNVQLSEDGRQLIARQDGYVVRVGSRVSVENVLDLNNVDSESGNIRFHGVVRVRGQVEDAYVVEAEKGIEVGGTVGKAVLTSKGDITIGGGALNAQITAGGNVTAKFLSDCEVLSGGSVVVRDYILHSKVEAEGMVQVTSSSKGFITGGNIRAGTEISAAILGSGVSEEVTILEVGSGVDMLKSFEALDQRINDNLVVFEKLRKNLQYLQKQRISGQIQDKARLEEYQRMVASGRQVVEKILNQSRKYHHYKEKMGEPQPEGVWIMGGEELHPGVVMSIQSVKHKIVEPLSSQGFTTEENLIKSLPYGVALKTSKQQRFKQQKAKYQEEMMKKALEGRSDG